MTLSKLFVKLVVTLHKLFVKPFFNKTIWKSILPESFQKNFTGKEKCGAIKSNTSMT